MSPRKRWIMCIGLLALAPASTSQPCREKAPPIGMITVSVAAAKQPGAPIEIVGFRVPAIVGQEPIILVENRAAAPVKRFWFAAIVQRADGLTGSAGVQGESVMPGSGIVEWPQGTESPQSFLADYRLASDAQRVLSDCLHAAIVVSHVEFEDGSSWWRELWGEENWQRKAWESSRAAGSAPICQHTKGIEPTLQNMVSTGFVTGAPVRGASAGVVKSFVTSCAIRKEGGRPTATCGW